MAIRTVPCSNFLNSELTQLSALEPIPMARGWCYHDLDEWFSSGHSASSGGVFGNVAMTGNATAFSGAVGGQEYQMPCNTQDRLVQQRTGLLKMSIISL